MFGLYGALSSPAHGDVTFQAFVQSEIGGLNFYVTGTDEGVWETVCGSRKP